jgi:hypothetical protein
VKLEKDLTTIDTLLESLKKTKQGNNTIPKSSNDQINGLYKKIYTNNNVLFKGTVQQNKFVYTIQCLNNMKNGMYLSEVGGKLLFDKKPFQWKIVKNKEVYSIQSVTNYYLNNQSPNKLVFLASIATKTPAPAPLSIDLAKITGTSNLGSIGIKSGLLEYRRGNINNNNQGDLAIPYKVLNQKRYKISIVIGDIKPGIVIQPLNGKIYDIKDDKPIKDDKISARSNGIITFNMVPTKDNNLYIKIFIPNQNDVLKIKSLTIQENPVVPASNPIPYIWTITEDLPSGGAFSISTGGNYLDCEKLELKSTLTSLWTINTVVPPSMST